MGWLKSADEVVISQWHRDAVTENLISAFLRNAQNQKCKWKQREMKPMSLKRVVNIQSLLSVQTDKKILLSGIENACTLSWYEIQTWLFFLLYLLRAAGALGKLTLTLKEEAAASGRTANRRVRSSRCVCVNRENKTQCYWQFYNTLSSMQTLPWHPNTHIIIHMHAPSLARTG